MKAPVLWGLVAAIWLLGLGALLAVAHHNDPEPTLRPPRPAERFDELDAAIAFEREVRWDLAIADAIADQRAAEAAEERRRARLRSTAAARPAQFTGGPYAIPTYIVMCESGGDYRAEHGGDRGGYSTASGAYQILDSTWDGYGGYSHAADAPPAVQDAKAAELWNGGAGRSHWAACL